LAAEEFFTAERGPERMLSATFLCSGVSSSDGISLKRRGSAAGLVSGLLVAIPRNGKPEAGTFPDRPPLFAVTHHLDGADRSPAGQGNVSGRVKTLIHGRLRAKHHR
jgi:hypothetical protein